MQKPLNACVENRLECGKRNSESGSSRHHQRKVTKAEMAVLAIGGLALVRWVHITCTQSIKEQLQMWLQNLGSSSKGNRVVTYCDRSNI